MESFGPESELALAKVAAAADARRRRRRELDLAAAEATFAGLLGALVDLGRPVAIVTHHGRLQGTPVEVGADCVVVEAIGGQVVVVRLDAVVAVQPGVEAPSLASDRAPSSGRFLADVVAGYVGTAVVVSLTCTGGRTFEGTVTTCGLDVATLRTSGGSSSYVALDSVNEVVCSSSAP